MLSNIDSIILENSNEYIQENTFNFGGEVCKVRDMLCRAHVSEQSILGFEFCKNSMCSEILKSTEFVLENKTCFGRIWTV